MKAITQQKVVVIDHFKTAQPNGREISGNQFKAVGLRSVGQNGTALGQITNQNEVIFALEHHNEYVVGI